MHPYQPPPPPPRRHQGLLAAVIIVAGVAALVGITQLVERASDDDKKPQTSRSVQSYKDQAAANAPTPATDFDAIRECQAGVKIQNPSVTYEFDRMATARTDYGWLVGGRVRPAGREEWVRVSCRVNRLGDGTAKLLDFRLR